MTDIVATIDNAQTYAFQIRPKVGGFPYLAEVLRQAGVQQYLFDVPSSSAVYLTADGAVLEPGNPLHAEKTLVPPFDEGALIAAIRTDQRGESTFSEFVRAAFRAGVTRYIVDTAAHTCTYAGVRGEQYVERYPAIELPPEAHPSSS